MSFMMSEALESRLGKAIDPIVFIENIKGTLVSVKLSKSPKIIVVTDDIEGGLNLLNSSPNKAIIKYNTFEYEFMIPQKCATLTVDRAGEKLRITLGAEIEKKKK